MDNLWRIKSQVRFHAYNIHTAKNTSNRRPNLLHLRTFLTDSFAPSFIVTDEDSLSDTIPIKESTIDSMVNYANFRVNEPTIRTSNQNATTTISLALRPVADFLQLSSTHLPISGFPRQLRKEDEITRTSCQRTPLKQNSISRVNSFKASRQRIEREAICRSQSQYTRHKTGSTATSPSQFSHFRHSEDEQTRASSAPTSGLASRTSRESQDYRLPLGERRSGAPMAELEGTDVDPNGLTQVHSYNQRESRGFDY